MFRHVGFRKFYSNREKACRQNNPRDFKGNRIGMNTPSPRVENASAVRPHDDAKQRSQNYFIHIDLKRHELSIR